MSHVSINDFKLLNIKCQKYFDLFSKTNTFSQGVKDLKLQQRFGFYLFMLESLCNEKDIDKISDYITDTEYNSYLTGERYDDHGVDAVYIDYESKEINLFNFKFRERFKADQKQSFNEAFVSTKLVNCIMNESTDGLQGKLQTYVTTINELLNGNDVWKLSLYMISNEALPIERDESAIQQLKIVYDMEVISICLPHITSMMSIRPAPINAELIIDNDSLMSYSESSISTSKSYVIRLNAADVIRITCRNADLRRDHNCENFDELANEKIDFGVLFDNVRGFVQRSRYNAGIAKTLREEPSKLFMYNNGLTIVADDIKALPVNGHRKVRISLSGIQVLNGGQTLRTLHDFNAADKSNISEFISKSELLVRIFNASNSETANKIAEYTNSQNSISNVDLKSLSTLQIQLEQLLDEHGIIYSRKNGDTGMHEEKEYRYKISMEQFGQILFAYQGYPEKSSNQKQHIFGKYYDDIFSEEKFNFSSAPQLVESYYEIKKAYSTSTDSIQKIEQKIFYVIYIHRIRSDWDYEQCIEVLEQVLDSYYPLSDVSLTDSRKMIQVRFREYLNVILSDYDV
ncbi:MULTISPECIES: AIPR family protein [Klebsiella pneumoniae complex]|uniref:Abortive phage resistance protein n=1 Tax=Klebsiella pneumoniae TaxID=573 RepID=A0A6G4MEN0_KLEPN|nr:MULTISPECIES: AIPR family protein [Klebsiella]EKX8672908.1 AIPR family protein [Klebsiella pneumoniae]MCB7768192.1 AIPR family protein [Klebsiella pneumoniae]MCE0254110.1 AIPR family protein [Klebsiella pneumoniae]MCI8189288.1 AIPR family protein [Klebsiella pneumoniae]MDS0455224.1 AIPR family protein [Klebsiella quasipneumoniae]